MLVRNTGMSAGKAAERLNSACSWSNTTKRIANLDARLSLFSAQYTFLLCYTIANIVLFFFGLNDEMRLWPDNPISAWGIGLARGFGYTLNLNCVMILILASRWTMSMVRQSPLNAILALDKAMPQFHALIGYVSIVTAALHGICHLIGGIPRNLWAISKVGGWRYCVITGSVLISVFFVMVCFALRPQRHKNFERFYYIHIVGACLFYILLIGHGLYREKLYTIKWVGGPIALYIGDRIYRKRVERKGIVFIPVDCTAVRAGNIVKLELPRTIGKFRAGQYAELKIPSISQMQWHPFTIASSPHESKMVFYIKATGEENSWTNQLRNIFKDPEAPGRSHMGDLEIHCRGPYGAPAQHIGQYDRVVLISGGVGATPFLSVTKTAHHIMTRYDAKPPSLNFDSLTNSEENASWDDFVNVVDFEDIGKTIQGIQGRQKLSDYWHGQIKRRPALGTKKDLGGLEYGFKGSYDGMTTETWLEFFLRTSYTLVGNTFLLWLLLIRFGFNLVALACSQADLERLGTQLFTSKALVIADAISGMLILAPLMFAIAIEAMSGKAEVLDIFLLLPLSAAQTVVDVLALNNVLPTQGSFSFHAYALVWPANMMLFLLRYFRIVGSRVLLVESIRDSQRTLRSLDFCWTTPRHADDEWLCSDLTDNLAHSRCVRLHRFITRETAVEVEADPECGGDGGATAAGGAAAVPGFTNNYGRPDWSRLFRTLVDTSPNGSTIGVFFCGNPEMGVAVKQAALHAMIDSTERGIALRGRVGMQRSEVSDGSDDCGLAIPDWQRSFNVRFIVRQEVF